MDVLWDVYPSLCADKEDCFFQVGRHRGPILLNLFLSPILVIKTKALS